MKLAGERTLGGKLIAAILAAAVGVGILTRADDLAQGIAQGLQVSGGVLIPALFPFMILSTYLVLTDGARILSIPLRPLTKHIFRLPPEHGAVVLVSLIGGYPVGGKMISSLTEQGKLDKPVAERMIALCFGASPAFVITAVGGGILLDRRVGVILFCAQVIASLAVGLILSLGGGLPPPSRAQTKEPGAVQAFVSAVTGSCSAMLNMCAFATVFSGLLFVIRGSPLPLWLAAVTGVDAPTAQSLIAGFFEVTAGCMSGGQLGGQRAILLISVFCSWGGLSSIFQVVALFGRTKLRWKTFFVGRAIHCALSAALSVAAYRAILTDVPAMAHEAQPVIAQNTNHWLSALCLLAMCAMLTAAPKNRPDKVYADR